MQAIEKAGRRKNFAKDEVVIEPGNKIVFVPIVITGSIRILRQDTDGRDIFLYHIFPGQTCAMSLTCCGANAVSQVKAVAEDETEVYMIPANLINEWLGYPEWRDFINNTYATRFNELMQVIDLIAFSHMDEQLLHYLRERARAINTRALFITHQQIADELRTQRESVTRLLRTMEQKGLVKLGRNTIELLA